MADNTRAAAPKPVRVVLQASVVLLRPTIRLVVDELIWCVGWVNQRARSRMASLSWSTDTLYGFLSEPHGRGVHESTLLRPPDESGPLQVQKPTRPGGAACPPTCRIDRSAERFTASRRLSAGAASLMGAAWYVAPDGALHLRLCGRRLSPCNRAGWHHVLGVPDKPSLHPFYLVYPDAWYGLWDALARARAGPDHCRGQFAALTEDDPLDEAAWASALDQTLELDTPDAAAAAAQLRTCWRLTGILSAARLEARRHLTGAPPETGSPAANVAWERFCADSD